MKTIKVIDLLVKIANGEEVPEKIQVYSDIFILDHGNMVYEHEKTRTNLLSIYNGNILNYEVVIKEEEIIEADKKIEEIKMDFDEFYKHYNIATTINGEKYYSIIHSATDKIFCGKINEIIDYINKNEEEK